MFRKMGFVETLFRRVNNLQIHLSPDAREGAKNAKSE
jgi:hypothetical protein